LGLQTRDITQLFWISRPLNVALAVVTFGAAAYISSLNSFRFLTIPLFWIEAFLITGIMATGYWVNDVSDVRIDRINKPHAVRVSRLISSKKVMTAYFVAIAVLMLLSMALPLKFILLNTGAIASLYAYALFFKRSAVIGNLIVAALTSMVVLAGALLVHLKVPHFWMMVFAFQLNFIREIVKDIEDLHGDLACGLHTLPILIGIRNSKWVVLTLAVLLLISSNIPPMLYYFHADRWMNEYWYWSMGLIQLPTLLWLLRLRKAYKPADFRSLSHRLKIMMVGGIIVGLFL
jgi:4-hydroxybenzoate polyprenyltransferase